MSEDPRIFSLPSSKSPRTEREERERPIREIRERARLQEARVRQESLDGPIEQEAQVKRQIIAWAREHQGEMQARHQREDGAIQRDPHDGSLDLVNEESQFALLIACMKRRSELKEALIKFTLKILFEKSEAITLSLNVLDDIVKRKHTKLYQDWMIFSLMAATALKLDENFSHDILCRVKKSLKLIMKRFPSHIFVPMGLRFLGERVLNRGKLANKTILILTIKSSLGFLVDEHDSKLCVTSDFLTPECLKEAIKKVVDMMFKSLPEDCVYKKTRNLLVILLLCCEEVLPIVQTLPNHVQTTITSLVHEVVKWQEELEVEERKPRENQGLVNDKNKTTSSKQKNFEWKPLEEAIINQSTYGYDANEDLEYKIKESEVAAFFEKTPRQSVLKSKKSLPISTKERLCSLTSLFERKSSKTKEKPSLENLISDTTSTMKKKAYNETCAKHLVSHDENPNLDTSYTLTLDKDWCVRVTNSIDKKQHHTKEAPRPTNEHDLQHLPDTERETADLSDPQTALEEEIREREGETLGQGSNVVNEGNHEEYNIVEVELLNVEVHVIINFLGDEGCTIIDESTPQDQEHVVDFPVIDSEISNELDKFLEDEQNNQLVDDILRDSRFNLIDERTTLGEEENTDEEGNNIVCEKYNAVNEENPEYEESSDFQEENLDDEGNNVMQENYMEKEYYMTNMNEFPYDNINYTTLEGHDLQHPCISVLLDTEPETADLSNPQTALFGGEEEGQVISEEITPEEHLRFHSLDPVIEVQNSPMVCSPENTDEEGNNIVGEEYNAVNEENPEYEESSDFQEENLDDEGNNVMQENYMEKEYYMTNMNEFPYDDIIYTTLEGYDIQHPCISVLLDTEHETADLSNPQTALFGEEEGQVISEEITPEKHLRFHSLDPVIEVQNSPMVCSPENTNEELNNVVGEEYNAVNEENPEYEESSDFQEENLDDEGNNVMQENYMEKEYYMTNMNEFPYDNINYTTLEGHDLQHPCISVLLDTEHETADLSNPQTALFGEEEGQVISEEITPEEHLRFHSLDPVIDFQNSPMVFSPVCPEEQARINYMNQAENTIECFRFTEEHDRLDEEMVELYNKCSSLHATKTMSEEKIKSIVDTSVQFSLLFSNLEETSPKITTNQKRERDVPKKRHSHASKALRSDVRNVYRQIGSEFVKYPPKTPLQKTTVEIKDPNVQIDPKHIEAYKPPKKRNRKC